MNAVYHRFLIREQRELPATWTSVERGEADLLIGDGGGEAGYDLLLLEHGSADGIFGSTLRSLVARDMIVLSRKRPFILGFTANRRGLLRLPANLVAPGLNALQLHGLVLRHETDFADSVAAIIRDVQASGVASAELPRAAADRFVSAISRIEGASAMPVDTRDEESQALLDRALVIIEQEIGSPALNPARLASKLAVSRAALYRAFEPHGGVSAFIRELRLKRSRIALALGRPRIASVAYANGFRGEAQFSRAFKGRFSLSPSAARRPNFAEDSEVDFVREAMVRRMLRLQP